MSVYFKAENIAVKGNIDQYLLWQQCYQMPSAAITTKSVFDWWRVKSLTIETILHIQYFLWQQCFQMSSAAITTKSVFNWWRVRSLTIDTIVVSTETCARNSGSVFHYTLTHTQGIITLDWGVPGIINKYNLISSELDKVGICLNTQLIFPKTQLK